MSVPSLDGYIQVAYLVMRVSVLLAAAEMLLAVLGRRASAATRHLIRTLAVVGLLLLPILSVVLPSWRMPIRVGTSVAPEAAVSFVFSSDVLTAESLRTDAPNIDIPWASAMAAFYAAGVLLLLARLLVEHLTLQRLARRAAAVSEPARPPLLAECALLMGIRRPLRVLRSGEHGMPMVFGTRVPTIVLPVAADAWSQDRRRAVLLHELAHVARYDCLTQLAAAVACAVYWIHPGVWWVAWRLRVERELACDDRVLAAGTRPEEYARHLLDLAYSLQSHGALSHVANMARPRQLEGRLRAIMDSARNRAAPARAGYTAGVALMGGLLALLAGAQPTATRGNVEPPPPPHLSNPLEGPLTVIESIDFVGNQTISTATLKRQMKGYRQRNLWTRMFSAHSPYEGANVDEDVTLIAQYYRDHGFITARVGRPELKLVRESPDRTTRFVMLHIPVVEGDRYKVGAFHIDGNTLINRKDLQAMFNVAPGMDYRESAIQNGLVKARQVYGAAGYFEFTGYPDFAFRNTHGSPGPAPPESLQASVSKPSAAPPIVDVTIRLRAGPQYFVNHLTWTGGATRERVIRREMRLVEGGVFNTEALKFSINRLNKLGYFKPINGARDVDVHKTPGEENRVDVNVRFQDR